MRKAAVVLFVAICASLTACTFITDPIPAPIEYSFLDPSKPVYPKTQDGARIFLHDVRSANWDYYADDYVQRPEYSLEHMGGDCADFAVMLASYIQEHWEYDTFVLLLRSSTYGDKTGHAVCYVRSADFPRGTENILCFDEPYADVEGEQYRPLDWEACTYWTWDDFNIGAWVQGTNGRLYWRSALEWYDTFYFRMSNDQS